jgi:hypothetical protein
MIPVLRTGQLLLLLIACVSVWGVAPSFDSPGLVYLPSVEEACRVTSSIVSLTDVSYTAARDNGTSYYFDVENGDDDNSGTSPRQPFRTLERARELQLEPGDRICLASGQTFRGSLILRDVQGAESNPVVVTTYPSGRASDQRMALIDASGYPQGIQIVNGAHIRIEHIAITANGSGGIPQEGDSLGMRCGILVTADEKGDYSNIRISDVQISDIFYEDPGHTRGADEVKTANGTERYGWGIRLINLVPGAVMKDIHITDVLVSNVSHTGIKLTSRNDGIRDVVISGCEVHRTGGPGIQMSGVRNVTAKKNLVDRSGSNDDSRKWGRGSGLWTWSSSDIIIEHNQFKNAKGPGDSAGCHIDFNCSNVIVQYNLSYHNAGGFIEILGNNYNCAYRYNISVNDGYRVKGLDGAFQEGKVFWLSGYQGNQPRKGPFNSYIYNNTVFTDQDIVAKIAVTKTASGVLVTNNIFCFMGESQAVLGDQYNPEKDGTGAVSRVLFKNNLFLKASAWPEEVLIHDEAPLYGDPGFSNPGGDRLTDYIPLNESLVRDRGIDIPLLPGDKNGLNDGPPVMHDILGNPLTGKPDMGAIELGVKVKILEN